MSWQPEYTIPPNYAEILAFQIHRGETSVGRAACLLEMLVGRARTIEEAADRCGVPLAVARGPEEKTYTVVTHEPDAGPIVVGVGADTALAIHAEWAERATILDFPSGEIACGLDLGTAGGAGGCECPRCMRRPDAKAIITDGPDGRVFGMGATEAEAWEDARKPAKNGGLALDGARCVDATVRALVGWVGGATVSVIGGVVDLVTIYCDVCEEDRTADGAELRTSNQPGVAPYYVCASCLMNEPCPRCDGYHHHALPCPDPGTEEPEA